MMKQPTFIENIQTYHLEYLNYKITSDNTIRTLQSNKRNEYRPEIMTKNNALKVRDGCSV